MIKRIRKTSSSPSASAACAAVAKVKTNNRAQSCRIVQLLLVVLLARCGTVFSVSAVVEAAVPAAVCRWGLDRAVLMWGGVSRGYTIIISTKCYL